MAEFPLSVFSTGHKFLEAPRWHDGSLWASDFFAGHVIRFADDGTYEAVATVPGAPSGLGFLPDGSVLVVSQADKTVQKIGNDGSLELYADFSDIAAGLGNDLLVTSNGHAYAGNFGFHLGEEDPKTTNLAHIDPDQNVSPVEGELLFPNGMVLTPDGVMLAAETFTHRISAFDVGEDGVPRNHRIWAQLDDAFHPDGIALDTDGGVWFANALTDGDDSGFYRVVEGGEITDKVPVAEGWAIACTFGGPNLETLYMMCNTTTLPEFAEGKSKGVVATADVGRRGSPPR